MNSSLFKKTAILVVFNIILVLWSFHGSLSNYFVEQDTLLLVKNSRIHNINHLWSLITSPLMSGTGALQYVRYYRPVTELSFVFDYKIWKLDPFGYHLTNLLLHAICGILLGIFVLQYSGNYYLSLITSLFFLVHPLSFEVVPAPARRQDILSTIFLLGTLVSWNLHLEANKFMFWPFFFANSSMIVSILSKEIGIISLGLILYMSYLNSENQHLTVKNILIEPLKKCKIPLLSVAIVLTIRFLILNGIGGKVLHSYDFSNTHNLIIIPYFTSLIVPYLTFILPQFLAYSFSLTFTILTFSVFFLNTFFTFHENGIKANFQVPYRIRYLCWVWMLLPLLLLIVINQFSPRSLYVSLVPFSILLGTLILKCLENTIFVVDRHRSLIYVLSTASIMFVFLAQSPLTRKNLAWSCASNVQEYFFGSLQKHSSKINQNKELMVHNLPSKSHKLPTDERDMFLNSISYFNELSIKSWLDLYYPTNDIKVRAGKTVEFRKCPENPVTFEHKEQSNRLILRAQW